MQSVNVVTEEADPSVEAKIVRIFARACLVCSKTCPLAAHFFSHKGIIRDGETSVAATEGGQRIKTAAVWKSRLSNESKTLEAMIPVNKQRPRNLRRDVIAAASRLRMELLSGKRIPRVYSASTFYLSPSPALRCLARVRFVSRWKHFHLQWAKEREKNGAPNISVDNRADCFSN